MALTNKLSAIGDAIRAKTGKSELMTLDQMPQEIAGITGGGSGGSGYSAVDYIVDSSSYHHGIYPTDVPDFIQAMVEAAPLLKEIKRPYLYRVNLNRQTLPNYTIEFTNLQNVSGEYVFANFGSNDRVNYIKVDFPSLTVISGDSAFFQYNNLCVSSFPALETISGTKVFQYSRLYETENGENFTFPNLKDISGEGAFYGIYNAGKLSLPAIESYIEDQTFAYSSLSVIDLGENLQGFSTTSKYSGPTYSAKKLTAFIIRATTIPEIKTSAKDLFNYNCPLCGGYGGLEGYIYVPKEMIPQYESATNWSTATGYFRAIEDYPEICGEVS